MSEEERKAMKYFFNLRATIDESYMLFEEELNVKCGKEMIKQISTVLSLIEKQQKEIEKLKEKQKLEHRIKTSLYDQIEIIKDELNVYKVYTKQNDLKDFNLYMNQNYISKDKIREIIKKLNIDIERNKRRKINNTKEGYLQMTMIAYDPEIIKMRLLKLL